MNLRKIFKEVGISFVTTRLLKWYAKAKKRFEYKLSFITQSQDNIYVNHSLICLRLVIIGPICINYNGTKGAWPNIGKLNEGFFQQQRCAKLFVINSNFIYSKLYPLLLFAVIVHTFTTYWQRWHQLIDFTLETIVKHIWPYCFTLSKTSDHLTIQSCFGHAKLFTILLRFAFLNTLEFIITEIFRRFKTLPGFLEKKWNVKLHEKQSFFIVKVAI